MLTARRWLINCKLGRINQCIRYMSTEGGNASNSDLEGNTPPNEKISEVSTESDGNENPVMNDYNNIELDLERLRAIRTHLESPTITIDTTIDEMSHVSDELSNHIVDELVKEHCEQITDESSAREQIAELVKEIISEEPSIIGHVEHIDGVKKEISHFAEEPSITSGHIIEEEPSVIEPVIENKDIQFTETEDVALPSEAFSEQFDQEVNKESFQAEERNQFEAENSNQNKFHFTDQDCFKEEGEEEDEERDEEFSYSAEQYQRTEEMIQRFIRVDHAGEVAANLIYAGQLAVLGRTKEAPIIQHMWDQEKVHRDKFNELIVSERVRPTVMLPVWEVAAFALGAGTALIGKEAAMACTVAVEDTIVSHYTNQIRTIIEEGKEEKYKDLLGTFKKFRDEELEHHDTGIKHDAELAPQYKILSSIIAAGCSAAIKISEKV